MSTRRLLTQLSSVTAKACKAGLNPQPVQQASKHVKLPNIVKFERTPPKPRGRVLLGALTSSSVLAVALGIQFQEPKIEFQEKSG